MEIKIYNEKYMYFKFLRILFILKNDKIIYFNKKSQYYNVFYIKKQKSFHPQPLGHRVVKSYQDGCQRTLS